VVVVEWDPQLHSARVNNETHSGLLKLRISSSESGRKVLGDLVMCRGNTARAVEDNE